MQSSKCECCGQLYRMNETFDVHGRTLCAICCEEFLEEQGESAPVQVVRCVDPTICAACGADNGDTPFRQVQQQPLCAACVNPSRETVRHPERGAAPVAAIVATVVFVATLFSVLVLLR